MYRFIVRVLRLLLLAGYDIATHLAEMPRVWLRRRFDDPDLAAAIAAKKPKRIALVAASPFAFVPFSLDHLVQALQRNGHLVVITQSSPALREEMARRYPDALVVARAAQGRDFGAYMDVLLLMRRRGLTEGIERLVLCNDSLFYNAAFADVAAALDAEVETWGCLFENFEYHYHAQSFYLVFAPKALAHPAFWRFWNSYRPFSSRRHSIDAGEVGLSQALIGRLGAPLCAFSAPRLVAAIISRTATDRAAVMGRLIGAGGPSGAFGRRAFRDVLSVKEVELARPAAEKDGVMATVATAESDSAMLQVVARLAEQHNPTHTVALLANYVLDAPIKRDVAQRGGYTMAAVLHFLVGYSEDEKDAIARDMRGRGLAVSYRGWRRFLFKYGRI